MHVVVYTVSGHSHTLDMNTVYAIYSTCSMREMSRRVVDCTVAALYPVDIPRGVCVLRTPLVIPCACAAGGRVIGLSVSLSVHRCRAV